MKPILIFLAIAFSALAQPSSRPSILVGTDAPAASTCDRQAVGSVYVRSEDAANGPIHVLRCTQIGALAYSWQPIDHLVVANLPPRCATGDILFRTGVGNGSNIYGCTSTDTWTAQAGGAGGSPGGSDGQVQYNSTGSFSGDSGLAYNSSTKSLGVVGSIVSGQSSNGTGSLLLNGLTSGTVTISAADAAGTWTLKVPTTAGTGSGLPVLSGTPWSYATVTGNTTQFPTWTGATTAARCVHTDASGNLVIAAADCGSGGGSGTVTSVGFIGGIVSVATATTTPAFTVAGTSGGIPYFSSASTWASSGALTANLPVFGGGAGSAPIVGTRSGNTTAVVTTTGAQTSGRCVEIDASGNHIASAAGCAAGAGTVSVVASGALTSTALVTGGGTTTLQTAAPTATMDGSGNISTPGTISSGVGVSTAGGIQLQQGTANTPAANTVLRQAPASVTAYTVLEPGTAATGFYLGTNSAGTVTTTQVASNGSGNVLLSAGTAAIASGKTLTASNSLTLAGTDSTTMTFPSTSATIARTDAANTFTGTQTVGALVATTVNGNTFTTGTGVLTIAASKTLTASNTLTLAGTDGTTMTFPSTSATIARTDAANTFAGTQTFTAPVLGTPASVTLTNATGLPEGGLSMTNITTNNVSITKHGFAPILPNDATKYLDGTGAYTVPAGGAAVTHQYGGAFGSPGGTALTTGMTTYFVIPSACTINAWNMEVDAGTATIKFWKIATGTAIPTSGNSINTSGVAISTGTAVHSTTVSDFTTTTVTAHDIGAVTITAVSGATFLLGTFECQ